MVISFQTRLTGVVNAIDSYRTLAMSIVASARLGAAWLAIYAAAMVSLTANAQTIPKPPTDFRVIQALTLKHNPELKAAFHHWKSQLEHKRVAGSLPDPTLSFDYFIEEIQTRTGPQEYRLMIAQKLPWFGKRSLASDIAELNAEKAFEDLQVKRNQLSITAAKWWSQGVSIQHQIDIAHEELELIKQIERIVRVRYRLSKAGHPDLIRVQLKRGQLENRLDELSQRLKTLSHRLAALTRHQLDPSFAWPGAFSRTNSSIDSQAALLARLKNNPTLKAIKLSAAISHKASERARLNNRPDITLKYGRMFTGEAMNPEMEDSGKDPQYVGIGINIPLWGSKNAGVSAKAHQERLSTEQKIASIENDLTASAIDHWSQLESQARQINRFKKSLIPQAETALTALIKSYQTGNVTFSDLIESEKTLLALKRQIIQLEASQWLTHLQIKSLVGEAL